MLLKELAKIINIKSLPPNQKNFLIKGITEDSRQVKPGYLFAAIKGDKIDGNKFIDAAVRNGAVAVISSKKIYRKDPGVAYIEHKNPRQALVVVAEKFFGDQPEYITAVTGTNGKTSTVDFCRQIWTQLGIKAASIGTIGVVRGNNMVESESSMTTPGAVEMHQLLYNLKKDGVNNLAMEASSHGLQQSRLAGVKVKVGAFTNLSRDHLDYHKTMKEYFAAKMQLFSGIMAKGSIAIINADIEEFKEIQKICNARKHKIISYGKKGEDITLLKVIPTADGQEIQFSIGKKKYKTAIPVFGDFQASNLLCAIGMVMSSGISADKIVKILPKLRSVPGRMEKAGVTKRGGHIYIDYAHTPDALEKAIKNFTLHLEKGGKIHTLFGCGGDRDAGKRPIMGKIADKLSDYVIVTDDNPRTEKAASIRKQIMAACKNAEEVGDRKKAINYAVSRLKKNDILIIAGKGHEKYQIIGNKKLPFDEVKIVKAAIKKSI